MVFGLMHARQEMKNAWRHWRRKVFELGALETASAHHSRKLVSKVGISSTRQVHVNIRS